MNEQQKIHLEYGRKLLEAENRANDDYFIRHSGGHLEKMIGENRKEMGLDIDPWTGKIADRPVKAACIWAARDEDSFIRFATENPNCSTVRGLHTLYKEIQKGEGDPSVYVYRMRGPISGELLEPQICKIGCADHGAAARIKAQSKKSGVGYIPEIERIFKCERPKVLEKLLHKKFASFKVAVSGQEWFRVSPEDVDEALSEAERKRQLHLNGDWVVLRPAHRV